ncbi:MAG: CoA pyrophosphatase [Ktedonobacterales bacterium]|nr:CoA pyrophosphatase [Ktedonobacterales bacterium]
MRRTDSNLPDPADKFAEGQAASVMNRARLLGDAPALADYLRRHLAAAPASDLAAQPAPLSRVAAVLVPLYPRDGAPRLLFTRRASTLSVHSGEISFPGGSRDAGDATLAETALRETYEELAIEPALVTLVGPLPPVLATVSNFVVAPYIGWLGGGLPPLRPHAAEVAEVIEAPLAALADPAIFHEEIWTRGGVPHSVCFYDFGSYRIWGLTGRILHTLLALLPQAEVE